MDHRFGTPYLVLYACLVNLIGCRGLPAKNHVPLFIFGDSLFDAGNNNYVDIPPSAQANYWPYGETFFKYPTGRFSDRRIIPDFIAEYANLPLIPPYLQPGSNKFIGGVNFAFGGSGALIETAQGYGINLRTQVSYFEEIEKLWRQMLGDAEAKKLISKAVYLISMGVNDYMVHFGTNSTVLESYSREEYVGMVIGNLTVEIKEIYKKGGRKFGFVNAGALDCTPAIGALEAGTRGPCNENATALIELHNAAFSNALQELESQLEGFKYATHDLYTSWSERIHNPTKYGFKEGSTACCGTGPYRGIPSCGGRKPVKEYQLCGNASEYVFFDSTHLTEKAIQQLAELMWSGSPNITGPYNLKMLFDI
ncbi:PREDICTED: GDSL esterase/lipase 2 [Theobroma cacao]|uniref:GDSL esterase/lipase 2 n=1 Tax=Theobroma cacao TaxID=3641 RepID=A0AB32VZ90_THECC|nr:PREDICTED: GDSL esterase/lipase 2 [Theobroma cacao]